MMNMPVVSASRLKGHVKYRDLIGGYRREIALTDEILRIGIVRGSDREEDGILVSVLIRQRRSFFIPDFLCQTEYRPALRPAHIHSGMGNDGGDFFLRHTVCFCVLQMIGQGRIGNAGSHQ